MPIWGPDPTPIDNQGVGRGLWFASGGNVAFAANLVSRFENARKDDLWSGLALAITYAGGAEPDELLAIRTSAGGYQAALAQGALFAAEARDRGGHVPQHTHDAVRTLTRLDVEAAIAIVREARARSQGSCECDLPRYEMWRRDVQRATATL